MEFVVSMSRSNQGHQLVEHQSSVKTYQLAMTNDHEFEAVRASFHDALLVSGLLLALTLFFLAFGKRRVMRQYPSGRSNKV